MGNNGFNHLARVISQRIKREGDSPLFLDFGEIKKNGCLATDSFPELIPKGEYSILQRLALGGDPEAGDRVLVAWVGEEAVVMDIVMGT